MQECYHWHSFDFVKCMSDSNWTYRQCSAHGEIYKHEPDLLTNICFDMQDHI